MEEIDRKMNRKARREVAKKRGDYDGRLGTRLVPNKREKYKHSYLDIENDEHLDDEWEEEEL